MSLKAFHVLFITASSALSVGCGVWGVKNFLGADGSATDLIFGLGSLAVGVALVVYGKYFLRKLKNVGYL